MKIKYRFVTGEVVTVEAKVSKAVETVIQDAEREMWRIERWKRRHVYSYDAIVYEGKQYGTEDDYDFD